MPSFNANHAENGSVSAVLRTLVRGTNVSQTLLAAETGLKKATISAVIKQLKGRGLVIETGQGKAGTSGGRRPRYLELSKKNIVAIGAAIRGKTLKISLVDLAGTPLWTFESEFERNHSSLWLPVLEEQVSIAMKKMVTPEHVFLGLGVSLGGMYDAGKGVYLFISNQEPGYQEHNLAVPAILRSRFRDIRIVADDFPNAMALGEVWFGCAADLNDFVFLQLENMKATVLMNKTIFRGHGMFAGQIGGLRYGDHSMRETLIAGRYSPDLLADLVVNLFLSYSPEKIILSKENLPVSTAVDVAAVNQKVNTRFSEYGFDELAHSALEIGSFDRNDRARAAATLVFDDFFHSQIFRNGHK